MIRLSLCPFVEKNTRMWGKCYPPKWGMNLFAKAMEQNVRQKSCCRLS